MFCNFISESACQNHKVPGLNFCLLHQRAARIGTTELQEIQKYQGLQLDFHLSSMIHADSILTLRNMHWKNFTVQETRLDRTHLGRLEMSGAQFASLKLSNSSLEESKFLGVRAEMEDCLASSFVDLLFQDCQILGKSGLPGRKLNFLKLTFLNCLLQNLHFEEAILDRIVLADCDLKNSVFRNCRFYECQLEGVQGITETTFQNCLFRGSSLLLDQKTEDIVAKSNRFDRYSSVERPM